MVKVARDRVENSVRRQAEADERYGDYVLILSVACVVSSSLEVFAGCDVRVVVGWPNGWNMISTI